MNSFIITFLLVLINITLVLFLIKIKSAKKTIYLKELFAHSSIAMEIKDKSKKTLYISNSANHINNSFSKRKTTLSNGSFIYYKDYTTFNTINAQIKKANEAYKKTNEFLLKDNQVDESLSAIIAERTAYESIDNILLVGTDKIEYLTTTLTTYGISTQEKKHLLGKISLLSCMMKRECMLSLNVFYRQTQPIGILQNAFDELSEFCKFSEISIAFRCALSGDFPASFALSIYSFFANALEKAIDLSCENILAQLYEASSNIVFSVLADKDLFSENELNNIVQEENSFSFQSKNWEQTQIYILTFSEEVPHDSD